MCDCGCNTCETKKAVMLNESIAPKEILSEGLKYHMNNNIPLTEHVYRAGSQNYFNLWAEARALYSRGILEVQGDDLEVLTETDLGHFGIFEGKKVPLDFPIEITEAELDDFPFEYKGFKYNVESTEGMVNDMGQKVWQVSIQDREGDVETTTVRGSSDREGHQEAKDFIDDELLPYYGLDEQKEYTKGDFEQMASREFKPGTATDSEIIALARKAFLDYKFGKGFKHHFPKTFLNEAKKKKKKDPPIGKPMRSSSGGKAYKVYVRDPKTKKVKTVRFGSGGLRAKINDPKARQAFAKRHKCSTKKDKTKASYWSCRLPRYAKLLGLKSSFSGFW